MVEPLGGLLGAGIITLSKPLLPCGLAFAASPIL
jgi:ZIP family zinc transporter